MAEKEVANLEIRFQGSFATFSADVGKLGKEFEKFGKKVTRIGSTLTKAFTVPLAAIGGSAVAAALKMSDAFDTIRAGTGKTGKELEGLNKSFETVAQTATQSVGETADVITKLNVGLGLTGKPLEDLTKQVLGVAQATKQDLGATVEGTTHVMNAWKVSTEDQSGAMEYLFKVAQATGTNFATLTEELSQSQIVLSRLGIGLKEGAALFAQLHKAGLDSSDIMNGFNGAVKKFTAAGVTDMAGAFRTAVEGISSFKDSTKAASAASDIFGDKAGPTLAALIQSGKFSVDDFVKSIDASGESIDKAVKDTDGFSSAWARLVNVLTVQGSKLGTPIINALAAGIEAIIPYVQMLGEAFSSLPEPVQNFTVVLGTAIGTVGLAHIAFGALTQTLGGVLRLLPTIAGIQSTFGTIGGALQLLISPLGLVALAVGAAIVIWYKWDEVKAILASLWDTVKAVFQGIDEIIGLGAAEAWEKFSTFCTNTIESAKNMGTEVVAAVSKMVTDIIDWFTNKIQAALSGIQTFADNTKAVFQGIWSSLPEGLTGAAAEAASSAAKLGTNISSPIIAGAARVGSAISEIGQMTMQSFAGMGTTVSTGLQAAMTKATAAVQSAGPPITNAVAGAGNAFDALRQKVNDAGKEGAKSAKELAGAWTQTMTDLKSVISDVSKEMDPLRQKITALLQAKDFSGLKAMAEGFKGSKEQLDQFRKSLQDGAQDYDAFIQRQKGVSTSIQDTKERLYELSTGTTYIDATTQSIINMMAAGDMEGLQALGDSMSATEDGAEKFRDSLAKGTSEIEKMQQGSNELAGSLSKLLQSFGLSSGFADVLGKGATSLLGSLFGGGGGGILEGVGGAGGGSGGGFSGGGFLQQIGNLFNSGGKSNFGGASGGSLGNFGSMFGGGMSTGAAHGAGIQGPGLADGSFGGATSGGMGGWGSLFQSIPSVIDTWTKENGLTGRADTKKKLEDSIHTVGMGVANYWTFGLASVVEGLVGRENMEKLSIGKKLIDALFSENAETGARKAFDRWIEGALEGKNLSFYDKNGQMKKFSGNFETQKYTPDFSNPQSDWGTGAYGKSESFTTFNAIGEGLKKLLGITEDVGGQIGYILSQELSGNIDNARMLMQQLGVTQQQMEDAFVSMGESGEMGWHEVEVSLQGVSQAFGEGLVAVGDFNAGFKQIVDSGGDGMDAIYGVKNAALEATEAGIHGFEEWKQKLIAAGNSAEVVNSFFQGLAQRGLTSFEQIADASTRTIGGVIADMQSASPALMSQWTQAQAEAQKYADTIASIPDESTKNVLLNITANVSPDARTALDSMDTPIEEEATAFARGGIITRPTFGLVGEAGPEAVVPLNRLQSMLASGSSASNGNTFNIDLRGAAPGVEVEVRRVLREFEGDIINKAMNATADQVRRGGSFAAAFGQ